MKFIVTICPPPQSRYGVSEDMPFRVASGRFLHIAGVSLMP